MFQFVVCFNSGIESITEKDCWKACALRTYTIISIVAVTYVAFYMVKLSASNTYLSISIIWIVPQIKSFLENAFMTNQSY